MHSLADILFRTVDGVFAVDAKQRIVYWNTACEQLFGVPPKKALGQPCCEIIRGKDPMGNPFCGSSCCSNLANGGTGPKVFSLSILDSKGNELKVSVSIVLVPSRHKNQWTCVHLLLLGDAVDTLDLLEYHLPKKQIKRKQKYRNLDCSTPDAASLLTAREQEILQLMAEGSNVPTISHLLNVSPVTVRNHIQHIESKLCVHSQAETVAYAYRHNLV